MKIYLGDSVYAETDPNVPGAIILTTENGFGASNTIVLEPEVLAAMNRFVVVSSAARDPILLFHDHLDVCEQCRNNPFGLCTNGETLLKEVQ